MSGLLATCDTVWQCCTWDPHRSLSALAPVWPLPQLLNTVEGVWPLSQRLNTVAVLLSLSQILHCERVWRWKSSVPLECLSFSVIFVTVNVSVYYSMIYCNIVWGFYKQHHCLLKYSNPSLCSLGRVKKRKPGLTTLFYTTPCLSTTHCVNGLYRHVFSQFLDRLPTAPYIKYLAQWRPDAGARKLFFLCGFGHEMLSVCSGQYSKSYRRHLSQDLQMWRVWTTVQCLLTYHVLRDRTGLHVWS